MRVSIAQTCLIRTGNKGLAIAIIYDDDDDCYDAGDDLDEGKLAALGRWLVP